MTNNEIIKAIERIAYSKMLAKEASKLRLKIISELNRRKKAKINLGGPSKEDYVKLNIIDISAHEVKAHKQNRLSYRISSDEKNMIRGIDL